MVSFELGKEIKKDVFHLVTNVGQRIYKHYAIDIADPSSMQDACHMNFVIDLAHRRVCGSVIEHRSAESEGLRFDSSWGYRMFTFVPCL